MKKVLFLFLLLGSVLTSKAADVEVYVSNTCGYQIKIDWFDGSCVHYSTTHVVTPGYNLIPEPAPGFTAKVATIYDTAVPTTSCYFVSIVAPWPPLCTAGSIHASDEGCCEPGSIVHSWWDGTVSAPIIHIN